MSVAYNTQIVRDGLTILYDTANPRLRNASGNTFYNGVSNTYFASASLWYGNNAFGYLQSDGSLFLDANENETSNNGNYLIAFGDLSSGMSNNEFSTSCWIYRTENKKATIAEYRGNWYRLEFSIDSTNVTFAQRDGTTPFAINYSNVAISSSINTWYNYVLTRSGTDMVYYRNGELIGSNTVFQQSEGFGVGATLQIGYGFDDDYPSRGMSGYLGHWCHYNKDLSAEEVKINFNALRKRYGV